MLLYWIWFAQLSGIPLWAKMMLLQHFSDPEEIYFAKPDAFSMEELTPEHREELERKELNEAEKILADCRKKDIRILTIKDSSYPDRLRNIADPPVLLYYKGILPDWDAQPVIGVVGTRKASGYGLQMAFRMGKQITQCGGLVVSGAASGIDTKAMQGALEEDRPVVGVLGCGVDVIYPRNNRKLYAQTIENGCLLSEYPPADAPLGWHFLRRNRIISGISNGIVVVEAPEKSGALNTANHARQQGREIFAVPANVGVDNSEGSNALLEEGAVAAVSGWRVVKEYAHLYPGAVKKAEKPDVLYQEYPGQKVAQEPAIPEKSPKKDIDNWDNTTYSVLNNEHPALTDEEKAVLSLVGRTPLHPDEVAAKSELPAARVQSILTKLTVCGLLMRHGGGRVSLK